MIEVKSSQLKNNRLKFPVNKPWNNNSSAFPLKNRLSWFQSSVTKHPKVNHVVIVLLHLQKLVRSSKDHFSVLLSAGKPVVPKFFLLMSPFFRFRVKVKGIFRSQFFPIRTLENLSYDSKEMYHICKLYKKYFITAKITATPTIIRTTDLLQKFHSSHPSRQASIFIGVTEYWNNQDRC